MTRQCRLSGQWFEPPFTQAWLCATCWREESHERLREEGRREGRQQALSSFRAYLQKHPDHARALDALAAFERAEEVAR